MAFLNIPIKDNSTPLTPTEWNYLVDQLNNRKLRDLIDVQSSDAQEKDMIRHNGSGWVFYDITDDHYTKEEINALFGVADVGSIPQLTVDWGNIQGTIRNQIDLVDNFGDLKAASNTWDGEHYAKNYILEGSSASQSTDGYMDYFYVSDGNNSGEISDKTTLKITGDGVTFDYVNKEFKINTQNTLFDIHNATGGTLLKGTVVYPNGTSTLGVSNVSKSIANSHETLENQLGVIYEDVLDGSNGKVMIQGVLRNMDTSTLSEGGLYLSAITAGELSNIEYTFPNYTVLLGVVDKVDALYGEITIDTSFNLQNDLTNFWNGTIRESFKMDVVSDGVNVNVEVYPANGHPNLTALFSDGAYKIIATPNIVVPLVAGTDTSPQKNYVYFLQSTKSFVVSTTGFPIDVEHVKLGRFFIQSATEVQSDGVLNARAYNDHVVDTFSYQGHLSHITERLRLEKAKWASGVDIIPTAVGASSIISLSGGIVYQLHKQAFQPFDMATGDHIHIYNHFTTPYISSINLNDQNNNAAGDSLSNSSFSIVYWSSMNSAPETQKVFANLPTGGYAKNAPELAVSDAYNYSVYDIPEEFQGTGFLIARVTYIREANGDWSVYATQDLRTSSGAGGGSGVGTGGITTFSGLTDTPNLYTGFENYFLKVGGSGAGIEYVNNVATLDATDNVFTGNVTAANLNVDNWDLAFGWGDHSLGEYLIASDIVNATMQGNTFNGFNQLVQLNGAGQLPAVDGSLLTGISTTDTWKQNTALSEGYVIAGGGYLDKVWATDGAGVPAWRTIATGDQVGSSQKKEFISQTVVNFAHNLGERYPTIQAYDENGFMIIAYTVQAVDDNNCTVTFFEVQSGTIAATVGGSIGTLPNNIAYSNANNAFSVAQTGVSFNDFTGFAGTGVATTGSRSDHTHNYSGVYAPIIHTHTIAQVTDLTSILNTKLEAVDINSTNWDLAFGWGDHSLANYLKVADLSSYLQEGDLSRINWDLAFGWGDHSIQGYLKSADLSNYLQSSDIGVTVQGYNAATTLQGVITAVSLGLGNVDNTSDVDKPVSTAQGVAIGLKEDDLGNPLTDGHILSSTIAGVRSWIAPQTGGGITNHSELTLDDGSNPHGTTKADVSLGNVDNVSDINKPISTATQDALDNKQKEITVGITAPTSPSVGDLWVDTN